MLTLSVPCVSSCSAQFVVTRDGAPYVQELMERAVQLCQSVVTASWIRDSATHGKMSTMPRTYQPPSAELLAASGASSSASSVSAENTGTVFRGWTFALSQSFSLQEASTLSGTITNHGGEVGLLSQPKVHHLVVRSIRDPACDPAFDRARHCTVELTWIERSTATGKLCWDRDCIVPKFAWQSLSEHPSVEDAANFVPVKFADQWWAKSKHTREEPPRDLAADFAMIRAEEKEEAAAAAAAVAALARLASEGAGEGKAREASTGTSDHVDVSSAALLSSTSRETDYHQSELVPCAEASVPGMLRLLLHDDIIGPALGLPYFSIPLIDLITDYLQWRRPRVGTRGFGFMRFWNRKRTGLTLAGEKTRPVCHRFRSVFPFNSKDTRNSPTNADSPEDLYHHLAVAGLVAIGGAPLHMMEAGDNYKKLWGRLAHVHVDELRMEDYAQLERMGVLGERGPVVDEDGVLLFDPAAPPSEDDTAIMPNPACSIPNVSVVGDYAVTLGSVPESSRYCQQLLKAGHMYYCHCWAGASGLQYQDPATLSFEYEGLSLAEAIRTFETRFHLVPSILMNNGFVNDVLWKYRAKIRNAKQLADAGLTSLPRELVMMDQMPRNKGNALYASQYAAYCLRTFVATAANAPTPPLPGADENVRAKYASLFGKGIAQPSPAIFGGNYQPVGTTWALQPPPPPQLSAEKLRQLRVCAKQYVRRVQRAFRDAPDTVATFLQIIRDADSKADDLDGVIARVRSLFTGTPHLLRAFNLYIPKSKRIVLDDAEEQRLQTQLQEPVSEGDDDEEEAAAPTTAAAAAEPAPAASPATAVGIEPPAGAGSSAEASTVVPAANAPDASAATAESASSASASAAIAGSASTETAAVSSSALPASPADAAAAAVSAPAALPRPVYTPECRTCASQLCRMATEVAAEHKARRDALYPPAGAGAPAFAGGFGGNAVPAPFGTTTTFGAAPAPAAAFSFGTAAPATTAPAFGFPAAPAAPAPPGGAQFNFGTAPSANSAVAAAAGALAPPSSGTAAAFLFGTSSSTSSSVVPAAFPAVGGFGSASAIAAAAATLSPPMDGTGGFKSKSGSGGFSSHKSKPLKSFGGKFVVQSHAQVASTISAQFGAATATPAVAPTTNPFGFGAAAAPFSQAAPSAGFGGGFGFGFGAPAPTTAATPSFGSSSPAKETPAASEATPAASVAAPADSSSAAAAAPAKPDSV